MNSTTPIYEGSATVIKVTPPDYRTMSPDADLSQLKADVTLRIAEMGNAEIHFPIERSRIMEFDEMAVQRATVPIRIG